MINRKSQRQLNISHWKLRFSVTGTRSLSAVILPSPKLIVTTLNITTLTLLETLGQKSTTALLLGSAETLLSTKDSLMSGLPSNFRRSSLVYTSFNFSNDVYNTFADCYAQPAAGDSKLNELAQGIRRVQNRRSKREVSPLLPNTLFVDQAVCTKHWQKWIRCFSEEDQLPIHRCQWRIHVLLWSLFWELHEPSGSPRCSSHPNPTSILDRL